LDRNLLNWGGDGLRSVQKMRWELKSLRGEEGKITKVTEVV